MRFHDVLSWTLLTPWLLVAQQNPAGHMAVHRCPADHFSISMPTGWVEIPKTELEQMSANVRAAAPNSKPQPYNYGFQKSADCKYPRVVVQVKTTGRWSEEVFAQLPKISTVKDEVQQRVAAAGPGMAALNIRVGELTYDLEQRIAYIADAVQRR